MTVGALRCTLLCGAQRARDCHLDMNPENDLLKTPLYDLHIGLGAKMVPFAGYEMPVQYPSGILAEHTQTRNAAGLFDVSHMGQVSLQAKEGAGHEDVAKALETLVPGDIAGLKLGQMRYTLLLNKEGGILDDLMVSRSVSSEDDGSLFLIVNAACKTEDVAHLTASLGDSIDVVMMTDRALLALQGPKAAQVLARHCPAAERLTFMTSTSTEIDGVDCHISRSGYTGEDGYEISIRSDAALDLAKTLLSETEVEPVGLGARDSLRLEAGLCLYGHDIDTTTSPVEAGLNWAISKRRRQDGDFPGAQRILSQLSDGTARKRVGLRPLGRAPAREGAEIADLDGKSIGTVTSGSFGPSLGGPIAMGYVQTSHAAPGTQVNLIVRGKAHPADVVPLPFVKQNYYRG